MGNPQIGKNDYISETPHRRTVLSLVSGSPSSGPEAGRKCAPEHLALKATGFDHKTSIGLGKTEIPLEGTYKVI